MRTPAFGRVPPGPHAMTTTTSSRDDEPGDGHRPHRAEQVAERIADPLLGLHFRVFRERANLPVSDQDIRREEDQGEAEPGKSRRAVDVAGIVVFSTEGSLSVIDDAAAAIGRGTLARRGPRDDSDRSGRDPGAGRPRPRWGRALHPGTGAGRLRARAEPEELVGGTPGPVPLSGPQGRGPGTSARCGSRYRPILPAHPPLAEDSCATGPAGSPESGSDTGRGSFLRRGGCGIGADRRRLEPVETATRRVMRRRQGGPGLPSRIALPRSRHGRAVWSPSR